jgi:hypothetical protein
VLHRGWNHDDGFVDRNKLHSLCGCCSITQAVLSVDERIQISLIDDKSLYHSLTSKRRMEGANLCYCLITSTEILQVRLRCVVLM